MSDDDFIELPQDQLVGKFYRGTIIKLRRGAQAGLVRSAATGKVLPFDMLHARVAGSAARFEDLREGLVVGYDVSWTQGGTVISTLWVPRPVPSAAPSVRPGG